MNNKTGLPKFNPWNPHKGGRKSPQKLSSDQCVKKKITSLLELYAQLNKLSGKEERNVPNVQLTGALHTALHKEMLGGTFNKIINPGGKISLQR